MKRIPFITCTVLILSLSAHAQSDLEILETVRANAEKIYLEQASFTLPDSFYNSGLAPADKERLIGQWASASALCSVDAVAKFAETTKVPLSELVNADGSFSLNGGPDAEFRLNLSRCLEGTWEAIGVSLPPQAAGS